MVLYRSSGKVVDLIEEDIAEKFDGDMGDSKLHGDALNKEKETHKCVDSNYSLGGWFLWHYIQRANRENFLYDLRCIDGESMQYTRYERECFMDGIMTQDSQHNINQ
ncbi:MAG: hypothetical protein CM15mV12_3270 [uncultured marine virus]|nr:MAG: hypothetical protein CM15mV12_3270 [uncultured marine virus]